MRAELIPCRACKREVAIDATRCPGCGKSYPGKQIGGIAKWLIVAMLAVVVVLLACSDQAPRPIDLGPCSDDVEAERLANPDAEETMRRAADGSLQVQFYYRGSTPADDRWVWYTWRGDECERTEAQV